MQSTHFIDESIGDHVLGELLWEFPFLQLCGEVAFELVVKKESDVQLGGGGEGGEDGRKGRLLSANTKS